MSSVHALYKKEAAVGSPTRSNVGLSLRNLIQYDDECDDEEEEATYDDWRHEGNAQGEGGRERGEEEIRRENARVSE